MIVLISLLLIPYYIGNESDEIKHPRSCSNINYQYNIKLPGLIQGRIIKHLVKALAFEMVQANMSPK